MAANLGGNPYETNDLPDFNELFTPAEIGRITKMKITRMELSDNGIEVLIDSINTLKKAVDKKNAGTTNTHEGLENLLQKLRKD